MNHWITRALALITWISAPALTVWIAFQVHTTTETACFGSSCASKTVATSDWSDNPTQTVAVLCILVLVGILPTWLIYRQGETGSSRLLAAMWVSIPILVLTAIAAAFTFAGNAAELWALCMLLAALFQSLALVTKAIARDVQRFGLHRAGE